MKPILAVFGPSRFGCLRPRNDLRGVVDGTVQLISSVYPGRFNL